MTNCTLNQSLFVTKDDFTSNFTYSQLMVDCKIHRYRVYWMLLMLFSRIGPFVILCILITNILICVVLTRRTMISPTNLILLGIAIADMLTALFPLPFYIAKNIPRSIVYMGITESYVRHFFETYFPTVFHTVSIWLTVALAVQRCIYVTMPASAVTICTIKSSLWTIGLVYLFAFVNSIIPSVIEFKQLNRVCISEAGIAGQVEAGVLFRCNPIGDLPKIAQLWFRIFTCNVIPCISLVIFTIILCIVIRRSEAKRRKLTNKSSERGRMKESNSATKMLIFVLVIFLVVEIPSGLLLVLYKAGIKWKYYSNATQISNFGILVSYPINFFVYYAMSQQFRETFRSLFGLTTNNNNTVAKGVKAMATEVQPLRGKDEIQDGKNHNSDNNGVKINEESV